MEQFLQAIDFALNPTDADTSNIQINVRTTQCNELQIVLMWTALTGLSLLNQKLGQTFIIGFYFSEITLVLLPNAKNFVDAQVKACWDRQLEEKEDKYTDSVHSLSSFWEPLRRDSMIFFAKLPVFLLVAFYHFLKTKRQVCITDLFSKVSKKEIVLTFNTDGENKHMFWM